MPTGNLLGFYEDQEIDNFQFNNEIIDLKAFSDIHILDELNIPRIRNNPDSVVNSYGRKLVDFCKNNNIFIFNGRLGKDRIGKPTSKNNSVVDYMISTVQFLSKINDFEVLEFSRLFSDIHSPLSLNISCKKPSSDTVLDTFVVNNEKYQNGKVNKTVNLRKI